MPLLTALAISIGVLGGVATYAFVGPAAGLSLQIWAAFIAWGAFYHSGGTSAALKTNIPAHILGGFLAWASLVATTSLAGSMGVPIAAGLCVGVGVAIMVLAANLPLFAAIPSAVYGFASVAAFALLAGEDGSKLGTLYATTLADNAFLNIAVSMVVGSVLGYLSQAIGLALAAKTPATASAR